MHMEPFIHDEYKGTYADDKDLKEVFQQFDSQSHVHNDDNTIYYHI